MRVVGLPLRDDPFIPEVKVVYWVDTAILPSGDPEEQRPVVVLAAPETTTGTVTVIARWSGASFGVEHPADPRLRLSTAGRFSRLHPVQCQLWTPRNVAPVGPLDDATFAAVVRRFGR